MKIIQNKNMSEFDIIVVTGLHGNEAFLFEELKEIVEEEKKLSIKLILANEEAKEKNIRFIDDDLNRIFKKPNPNSHEGKLVPQLINNLKGKLIVDFHTHSENEIFSLISKDNLSEHLKNIVQHLEIPHCILINPSVTGGQSLIENFNNSLSIEVGKHFSETAANTAKEFLYDLLSHLKKPTKPKNTTLFLEAIEFISNDENVEMKTNPQIKNFEPLKKGFLITNNKQTEYACTPTLVSRTVAPGKKFFMSCIEYTED